METYSRRTFLKGVAATTCGSCIHGAASPFFNGGYMAWAAPQPAQFGALGANPLLILVNLDGGCSYNITPIYVGAFRDRNRTISYGPENSIQLTPDQGLHPSLIGLKPIWNENNLALLNLVGLNDPTGLTRSHQDGADIKLTGITNVGEVRAGTTPGWVLRMSAQFGEPYSGIVINSSRQSIMGGANPPLSITTLDALGEQTLFREEVGEWTRFTRSAVMNADSQVQSPNQAMIRNTMASIDSAFERLGKETDPAKSPLPAIPNPFDISRDASGFIRACRDAARLALATSLRVRYIYLEHRGFDTHGEERATMVNLLNTLNNGLAPLIQTLKASGRWNDTVIATLTEFGRTHQTDSGGSDHGAATSMLVMGGKVKGRQVNQVPTGTEINKGNFFENATIDFRHVFYEIIAAMGLDPEATFPYRFVTRPIGLF